MKLHSNITINGKPYKKGDHISAWSVYPFFLFHMLMFGGSGFAMAYLTDSVSLAFLYLHGGFAIFIYLIFYIVIFGLDAIRWMIINALIGIFGIYSELRIILDMFDKNIADYSFAVHVIPFSYYILYTFLIYRAVLSFTGADNSPQRKQWIETIYIAVSVLFYLILFLMY